MASEAWLSRIRASVARRWLRRCVPRLRLGSSAAHLLWNRLLPVSLPSHPAPCSRRKASSSVLARDKRFPSAGETWRRRYVRCPCRLLRKTTPRFPNPLCEWLPFNPAWRDYRLDARLAINRPYRMKPLNATSVQPGMLRPRKRHRTSAHSPEPCSTICSASLSGKTSRI